MASRRYLGVFCAALLCLFTRGYMHAQAGRGAIRGSATDSAGAVLQGAEVTLDPLVSPTVSGLQGEFTFPDLAPGNYTLTVSYVGFSSFTTSVTVRSGQVTHIDAKLAVATTNEEVMVYADRPHGEAEAINRERTSDNILQVLPSEVITSLPNTNIADALGRLPSVTLERDEGEGKYVQIRGTEPRLSNVTIDGVNVASPESDVRQIKLDVIPADLVESVEINKTLSANQDGDAIGGSVNLVTKTAGERPTIYLNGVGGYTPIVGGRTLQEFDGTIGQRFGTSEKLGILFGGSYDWNGRGIDDVEPSPIADCDAACVPTYDGIDLREYRYERSRYGFAGSVDYKLGEVSGLYLHFLYSHFNNFGDRWVYGFGMDSFDTPSSGTGSVGFSSQIRRPVEVIGSMEVGGKHVFNKYWLAWDVSVSRSSAEDHRYTSAKFSGPEDIPFAIDTQNPLRPNFIPQGGFSTVYQPSDYNLKNIEISKSYGPQLNLQGSASMARTYKLGQHFASLEFGGKLRNAHKFEDARDSVFDSNDNPAMTDFLGSFTNSNYYDKSYTLGPTTDFDKIRGFFKTNPGLFTSDTASDAQNTFPNNYDLIERVSAGYVMNTVDFGRLRLQTGVRFEGTNESLLGYQVFFDGDTGDLCAPGSTDPNCIGITNPVVPLQKNSSYLDVLPSVQVRFALPHDAAIRAAYGRGTARPNFSDLPPTFNAQGNTAFQIDIGNPNLKPTHANNYDLLYEQYLKPLGLLQAGFFYKQLYDPIFESVVTPITSNQFGSQYNNGQWSVSQPINGSGAHLYGFEIAYQQHLTFLPRLMSGLGISANYSYTKSQIDGAPGRSDKPALARQAPNTWNISPTYDRRRVSIRVGVSHNDANIFSYGFQDGNDLGIKGPGGDTYLYAHTQVDAQGSFRMYRGLQLIASGLNLTNEVFGFYNGSPHNVLQREYYKPSYSLGLRYTFSNEPR